MCVYVSVSGDAFSSEKVKLRGRFLKLVYLISLQKSPLCGGTMCWGGGSWYQRRTVRSELCRMTSSYCLRVGDICAAWQTVTKHLRLHNLRTHTHTHTYTLHAKSRSLLNLLQYRCIIHICRHTGQALLAHVRMSIRAHTCMPTCRGALTGPSTPWKTPAAM